MPYLTFGPYDLDTIEGHRGKTLDLGSVALKRFWARVEQDTSLRLQNACGIYVFGHSGSHNITPWYVGQSKRGFEGEAFNPSNINKYQHAYSHHIESGEAVMFLIPKLTSTQRLAKAIRLDEADFVEQTIIRHALRANDKLINNKNTRLLRSIEIQGILNSSIDIGELNLANKRFRRMLSLKGRNE